MAALYENLKRYGKVKVNAPLARLTTFKIGGPARFFVEVINREKLVELLNFLSGAGEDFFIIGGGSNVLLPDDGIEGVVIKYRGAAVAVAGTTLVAESGALLGAVVTAAPAHRLSGLEWAAGIPGTVGGAVRGNAGAAGGDIARSMDKVTVWRDGEVVELARAECGFGYRESIFKHSQAVVLSARFALVSGDPAKSLKAMQEIVKKRAGHYPPLPSAGSFFKNVPLKDWPGDRSELPPEFVAAGRVPAGLITEQLGLKGLARGGAMLSREHGNFLINFQNATQADVLAVVEEVKDKVYTTYGIVLEEEVRVVR